MVSSLEESFDNEEEHDDDDDDDDDDDCGNDNDDDCGNDGDCCDDDSCSLDGYNEEQYDHKEIRRDIEDEEEQESKDEGQQMTLDCNDQSINGNSSGFSRRSQIKNRIISRQSNPVSTSSSGSYQTDERLSIKSKKIQPCDSCDNQRQRSRSSSRSSPRRSPSNSNSSQISGERRSRRSRSNSRYSRRSRSNSGESRSMSDSIEEENEASQLSSEVLSEDDDDDDDDENEDNESAQEVDPINIFNEDKEQQIYVKINQKNQSSRNNKQKLPKSQQILKSQPNSHTSRNSTQQFIINDQPREATKISSTLSEFALEQACLQPLQDKLITYKKIKQSLIRNTNPTDLSSESITHKFLCEIIYDQFEEEKLIRAKYLPKAIGYLYSNFKPTEDRYLRRIIDDKELRRLKAIDIERMISRKEKRQHNSQDGNSENLKKGNIISRNRQLNEDNNKQSKIMSAANKGIGKHSYQQQVQQPKVIAQKSKQSSQILQDKKNNNNKSQISLQFYSSRLMEWLSVCKSKSNDQTQHQRILTEFHEKRRSLEGYQNCQILREILQDILLSASISYYNNTKIAQLVCPLLLSTDISIKFFVKCLLRKSKHATLFIPPGRIITQLAQRHKSLLA